jgi:probable HAF family extracellular repeat protein
VVGSNGATQNGNFYFDKGKITQIVIPAVSYPEVVGINPQGTAIVGHYETSPGVFAGFIYKNATLTTLQFPGSRGTGAIGINGAGQVVGNFGDTNGNGHGFLWTPPADAAKKLRIPLRETRIDFQHFPHLSPKLDKMP